ALAGQFASWAGGILGIHSKPVLIGGNEAQIDEARMRLARVGIEDLRGYLVGGVTAWQKAGLPMLKTPQISVQELNQKLSEGTCAGSTSSMCAAKASGKPVTSPKCNGGRWIPSRMDY